MVEFCAHLDSNKQGKVSVEAYLLACRSSGILLHGSVRDKACQLAEAGGNAVRLPTAWKQPGRQGEGQGSTRASAPEDGDGGYVRYTAMDKRLRAAWSRLFGYQLLPKPVSR
jgi:hypothetical protein